MTRASLFYLRQKKAATASGSDSRDVTIKLAGVTKENCPLVVAKLTIGEGVILRRLPDNPKDANAIGVYTVAGERAGYIPAQMAAHLAPIMDAQGSTISARVHHFQGDQSRGHSRGVTIIFHSPVDVSLLELPSEELDI